MLVQLRRSIDIKLTRIVATLALPAPRVLEGAVLEWVHERHASGAPATVAALCDPTVGVLPGRPLLLATRFVEVCTRLGLVRVRSEGTLDLTAAGETARQDGVVLVPEKGPWEVWWSRDPLLRNPIVQIRRYNEPPAWEERKQVRQRTWQRTGRAVPPEIARQIDQYLRPPVGQIGLARVEWLGDVAEDAPHAASLVFTLELSDEADSKLRMRGTIHDRTVDATLPAPDLTWFDAWDQLLSCVGLDAAWDGRALRCAFVTVPESSRHSMSQTVEIAAPLIRGIDRFEPATVLDVPIGPATLADAQPWFDWLLAHADDRYVWPDTYPERARQTAARFQNHSPRIGDQSTFARQLRAAGDPAYWRFQASLDLGTEVAQ